MARFSIRRPPTSPRAASPCLPSSAKRARRAPFWRGGSTPCSRIRKRMESLVRPVGMNYIYGTWSALCAWPSSARIRSPSRCAGPSPGSPAPKTPTAVWARERLELQARVRTGSNRRPGTASQTAWALLGLMAAGEADCQPSRAASPISPRRRAKTGFWSEPSHTATGFPRVIHSRYHGYSKFFSLWGARPRHRNRSAPTAAPRSSACEAPPTVAAAPASRSNSTPYCFAQRMTAFAPPSQLAPVVPNPMCKAPVPPAQEALAIISFAPHAAWPESLTTLGALLPAPGGPAGPAGPAEPADPRALGNRPRRIGPASPFGPAGPAGALSPSGTRVPWAPRGRCSRPRTGPASPFLPCGPITQRFGMPSGPGGPAGPGAPAATRRPLRTPAGHVSVRSSIALRPSGLGGPAVPASPFGTLRPDRSSHSGVALRSLAARADPGRPGRAELRPLARAVQWRPTGPTAPTSPFGPGGPMRPCGPDGAQLPLRTLRADPSIDFRSRPSVQAARLPPSSPALRSRH